MQLQGKFRNKLYFCVSGTAYQLAMLGKSRNDTRTHIYKKLVIPCETGGDTVTDSEMLLSGVCRTACAKSEAVRLGTPEEHQLHSPTHLPFHNTPAQAEVTHYTRVLIYNNMLL